MSGNRSIWFNTKKKDMKTMIKYNLLVSLVAVFLISCDEIIPEVQDSTSNDDEKERWSIPVSEIKDGGPGKDGIPALTNPELLPVSSIAYLEDSDLVLGYKVGEEVRAYPHAILDWHEIINDDIKDQSIAITYCPLTGTGIGWDRYVNGKKTTFGVSGLLYNSNLIPYDRNTDSNWSQILLESVNGELLGTEIKTRFLIETTWKTWKEFYPRSKVVSTNTGYDRNYGFYPYGNYKSNENLIFPAKPLDERLPAKERVHAIIIDDDAKVYKVLDFKEENEIIHDEFNDTHILVIGNSNNNYVVSFYNPGKLAFKDVNSSDKPGIIMEDELGNEYNLFGEVVNNAGDQLDLEPTVSFMAYWFSIGAFYPSTLIY